jgi:hypothetical protein
MTTRSINPTGVVTTRERQLAVSHWLLTAAPDIGRARWEWEEHGIALLACGGVFAAVRLDGDLVRAAARAAGQEDVDAFLVEAVDGPLFRDCRGDRFYALVPSSAARRWNGREFPGTDALGRDTFVGVPDVSATEPVTALSCYWVVLMDSPGVLCDPARLAGVARLGYRRQAEELELPAAPAIP